MISTFNPLKKINGNKVTMLHPSDSLIDTYVFLEHFLQCNNLTYEEYHAYYEKQPLIVHDIDLTPYAFVADIGARASFGTFKKMYHCDEIKDLADVLAFVYLIQYYFS